MENICNINTLKGLVSEKISQHEADKYTLKTSRLTKEMCENVESRFTKYDSEITTANR